MSREIKIGVSPLSNRIFVGGVLKKGVWASNKTDVTNDAILSVIEHAMRFKEESGKNIQITNEDGSVFCELIVNLANEGEG
jgi:hypothetical protein